MTLMTLMPRMTTTITATAMARNPAAALPVVRLPAAWHVVVRHEIMPYITATRAVDI